MTQRKIEVLAPAGSYAAFRAALSAGADAVYAGGRRFGARAYAENFTEEEMIQAIQESHIYGRKFYLTVNTLLKECEIKDLYGYLAPLYENGLDAVIVQDMGVLEYVREYFPGMDIHASTQMTITGALGAKFLETQGVSRVVPARELSLGEIREIREKTGLEIECFVHGALCYCYSGQCLLSSMIGGRSGNRGQCAQPCRLPYTMNGEKKYLLSPKDICTLELIPDMAEAGIDSFKIEGRMKKPEYVAGVTAMYRKYTDLYLRNGRSGFSVLREDREILMDLYNRGGFSEGYYREHNGRGMMATDRPNHAGVPAVKVQFQKGREVHGLVLTDLNHGDVIEITGGKSSYTLGKPVEKGSRISFLVQKQVRLPAGAVLNRIRNESLIRRLHEKYTENSLQQPVFGALTLYADAPGVLTVRGTGKEGKETEFTALTPEPVQRAQKQPVDEQRVRNQMNRTGASEFFFSALDVQMEEGIFLPMQQLNRLRRDALEGLREEILLTYRRSPRPKPDPGDARGVTKRNCSPLFSVLVETENQLQGVFSYIRRGSTRIRRLYLDMELAASLEETLQSGLKELCPDIEIFIAMPYIFRTDQGWKEKDYKSLIPDLFEKLSAGGILIRNCEEYEFLKEQGFDKKIILDHNLYVFNRFAGKFWTEAGISEFTAPVELNERELDELGIGEAELIVYGYLPVMLSAQCVRKTSGTCTGRSGMETLTDRYGNQLPVKCSCRFCYNVIYNSRPSCLAEEARAVKDLAPRMLRIQFSSETEGTVSAVLNQVIPSFEQAYGICEGGYISESAGEWPEIEYTSGHFRRGIR